MAVTRTIKEGVWSGLLGAGAVALWFFVVDLVTQRPLHTPRVLAEALLGVVGLVRGQGAAELIALYTIGHVAVFVLFGILAAWILNASESEPSHLAGLFLLFVAFEGGFYLYLYALSLRGGLVDIAWYQIAAANLLAAVVMGRNLFRSHPDALRQMNEALAGRT